MDNLVSKTIKFFFVPEAELAVLFLFVFAALFCLGIYWALNCRKAVNHLRENAETEYEAVRAKMSPELFIKKYLNKISATEGKLEGVPEAFISIGIIATFLGLGVAIQGSAELLADEKIELTKLTAVLGVIAFKFQTSVWGICFSLIFRSLVVDRYFDFRQETVDYVNDLLYTIERDGIRTLLEKQNEFLSAQALRQEEFEAARAKCHENLIAENRQLFNALFEKIAANHQENLRESQNRSAQIAKIETTLHADNLAAFERLQYITDNLAKFVDAAKIFTESADKFSECVEKFRAELTDSLNAGFEKIRKSNEDLGILHSSHIEEIHKSHAENVFYVTEKLDELHQKFYLDSKRYVEETQRSLENMLEKTVDKINDGYIREAAEIRATIGKLNETLQLIENRTNLVNADFINRQTQFVNDWRGVTQNVSDTLKTVAETSAENSAQAARTYQNLQAITNALQNLSVENVQKLTGITEQAAQNFNAAMEKLNGAFKDFNVHSKNFANAVDGNLATLAISQKTNAENLNAVTTNATEKFSAALKDFADIQSAKDEKIAAIAETLKQILDRQAEIISALKPPAPLNKVDTTRPKRR